MASNLPNEGGQEVMAAVDRNLSQLSIEDDPLTEAAALEAAALEAACKERPYLDGTFFAVDAAKSSINGAVFATCQKCHPAVTIKGGLTVSSNFTTHLKRKHPDAYEEYQAHKLAKRNRHGEVCHRRVTCTYSQEAFNENVTKYVLESLAPLSTVELPSFRKMFDDLNIKKGNERIEHMTRYTLGKRIQRFCDESMASLRRVLAANTAYVCTTADIWTGSNRRFMGVTVHWLDEQNLQRKSAAIACRRFPGTHSHENIAKLLSEIHTSFGLTDRKIIATITDNGSNFVKAFEKFGIDLSEQLFEEETLATNEADYDQESMGIEETSCEERVTCESFEDTVIQPALSLHFRCASHTLNLIATTDALKYIQGSRHLSNIHSEAIGRCSTLWKYLRSPKKNEALKTHLGVALLRPVVTRWNSLYDSLKQIVSLKDKLNNWDNNEALTFPNPLRDSDFWYIEEYLSCMKPLAEAIDILQGEVYCYYGYLLPALLSLRRKLIQLQSQNTVQVCQPLLKGLIDSLQSRFEDFFEIKGQPAKLAAVAAVTHPKFRCRWFPCLTETLQNRVRDIVLQSASNIAAREVHREPEENAENDYFEFGEGNCTFGGTQLFSDHGDVELEVMRFVKQGTSSLSSLDEFPLVRKLFIRSNTPLPSSASVERLFSYATMMNLPKYNRLTDVHFEQRVLAKANSSKLYQ